MGSGDGFGGMNQFMLKQGFSGHVEQDESGSGNLRTAFNGKHFPAGVGVHDSVVGLKIG